LIFDQMLRRERGVNLIRQAVSLSARRWPSIHPYVSATSSASPYVSDLAPLAFFASCNQTPDESAWCFASHRSHADADASSRTGVSEAELRRDVGMSSQEK
jgi:hypothetical protein